MVKEFCIRIDILNYKFDIIYNKVSVECSWAKIAIKIIRPKGPDSIIPKRKKSGEKNNSC